MALEEYYMALVHIATLVLLLLRDRDAGGWWCCRNVLFDGPEKAWEHFHVNVANKETIIAWELRWIYIHLFISFDKGAAAAGQKWGSHMWYFVGVDFDAVKMQNSLSQCGQRSRFWERDTAAGGK